MQWRAQAPSNIALIKYMGKKETAANLPDNASLSYTLNQLLSTVQLECIDASNDRWEALNGDLELSSAGQQKFLNHLARLKAHFGYQGSFLVKSANNFPHSSGLASSASSFAALTRCAVSALSELTTTPALLVSEQALMSRLGSGSSCRSFYSPWVLWQEEEVKAIELPYEELLHQVIVISAEEKKVSSSEAHQRVKHSTQYATRAQRAEGRLSQLLMALNSQKWADAYQICWDEFQDMHQLFHTCERPFSYISEESLQVLNLLQELWNKGDGPLVTMDAGPNIHLLYRLDQAELASAFQQDHLKNYVVL